jgi:hypothetical protein
LEAWVLYIPQDFHSGEAATRGFGLPEETEEEEE